MRILLIITFFANIAFAFGTVPWLPEQVAVHFGIDGVPTRFAPPMESAVMMSVNVFIMGALFFGVSLLMPIIPSKYINLPNNRDYWLNEENRPKTMRRICSSIELIGVITMFFMLLAQWETFRANQMVPPKLAESNVWFGTGVQLVCVAIVIVRLLLAFRLPKEKD